MELNRNNIRSGLKNGSNEASRKSRLRLLWASLRRGEPAQWKSQGGTDDDNEVSTIFKTASSLYFLIGVYLSSSLLFISCSIQTPNEFQQTTQRISVSSILSSEQSDEAKAEELAQAAEKLFDGKAFPETHEVALKATQLDPKNFRAQFFKTITEPLTYLKGIYARLTPLMMKSPTLYQGFLKFTTDSTLLLNQTLPLEYLNSDTHSTSIEANEKAQVDNKIDTEEKFQLFLDELINSFQQLRQFLKESKQQVLTIKSYSLFKNKLQKNYVSECKIKIIELKNKYEIQCPDSRIRTEITFNRADFELLQLYATKAIIQLSLFTAYNVPQAIETHSKKAKDPNLTNQSVYDELLQNKDFGTIRNVKYLTDIKSYGLDIIEAAKWIGYEEQSLCSNSRPGMFESNKICLNYRYRDLLHDLEQSTVETPLVKYFVKEFQSENDTSNYKYQYLYIQHFAPFIHPITDIRTLGKVEFDECGHITNIEDQAIGGLLPPMTSRGTSNEADKNKGKASLYFLMTTPKCNKAVTTNTAVLQGKSDAN